MIPAKPFQSYKWRWLSATPTENLLYPPVLLGVLRVLARHQTESPSSPQIAEELLTVEAETATPVSLARDETRNLIRNSGQYWKGMGLLAPDRGQIRLTPLGLRVANGHMTQGEFAAAMVQYTVLPNPWTYKSEEMKKWKAAGLTIRPLALILEVMNVLGRLQNGQKYAYLTPHELIRVVIPLAGTKASSLVIAENVVLLRKGQLDVSNWPDCAPDSNDERLVREFLLFLSNFGLCQKLEARLRRDERYYLPEVFDVSALTAISEGTIYSDDEANAIAVEAVLHSSFPSIVERQRTVVTRFQRSGQSRFRDSTLNAYGRRCFLSGEKISEVLEAAHIIPVPNGGADTSDNGVCLRVDIHRLFDLGHLRIRPSGDIHVSERVAASSCYVSLPKKVVIPKSVNPANLLWRDKYL